MLQIEIQPLSMKAVGVLVFGKYYLFRRFFIICQATKRSGWLMFSSLLLESGMVRPVKFHGNRPSHSTTLNEPPLHGQIQVTWCHATQKMRARFHSPNHWVRI